MSELLEEIYCEILGQDRGNGKARFVCNSVAYRYIQKLVAEHSCEYNTNQISRLFGINIEIYNDCNGFNLVDKKGSIVAAWHWLPLEQRLQLHSEVR